MKLEISNIIYLGTVGDQTCTYPSQTSMAGLRKIAMKVWYCIISEYLDSLYKSMPRQMLAVIAAGEDTKY